MWTIASGLPIMCCFFFFNVQTTITHPPGITIKSRRVNQNHSYGWFMALFHPHCIHIHVFVLERFPIILNQHCFTHIRRNHMHLFWSDPVTFFPGAMGPGNASGLVEEMPSPDPHVNPINPHQMFTYDFFDHFRPPKKVSPTWRVPHVRALHLREKTPSENGKSPGLWICGSIHMGFCIIYYHLLSPKALLPSLDPGSRPKLWRASSAPRCWSPTRWRSSSWSSPLATSPCSPRSVPWYVYIDIWGVP